MKVDDSIEQLNSLKSEHGHLACKVDQPLSFKPDKDLGEGRPSKRNLKYRQALLTCLKETVYDPMTKIFDSNKSVDEGIEALDNCIDNYIMKGKEIVEKYLADAYQTGADQAISRLKNAAHEQDVNIKPRIPDQPERLQEIIRMQEMNVEDYGLTLRGRLRSAIMSKRWLDA